MIIITATGSLAGYPHSQSATSVLAVRGQLAQRDRARAA